MAPVLSALEGVRGLCLVIRSVEHILWRVKSQAGMDGAKSPLSSGTGRQAGNGWERGGVARGIGISFYGNGSLCYNRLPASFCSHVTTLQDKLVEFLSSNQTFSSVQYIYAECLLCLNAVLGI